MEAAASEEKFTVVDVSQLRAAGLTEQQIAAVSEIVRRYQEGHYDELSQGFKRLMFVKWLFAHGKLKS